MPQNNYLCLHTTIIPTINMQQILSFLTRLRQNNDRDWFNAHKQEYNIVRKKTLTLTQALIQSIATIDPETLSLTPADCTYRIYRDTRFSTDKTPYKTHIGIFINPPEGKKSLRCGYYLHIEPRHTLLAAGTIQLPTPIIRAIRQSIYDNIGEYRSIIESPEFRRYFPEIGDNLLKTAPKGFPKDWPYIHYLRPRDFIASGALFSAALNRYDLSSPDAATQLALQLMPALTQAKRFNDFINYAIDELSDPDQTTPIPQIL